MYRCGFFKCSFWVKDQASNIVDIKNNNTITTDNAELTPKEGIALAEERACTAKKAELAAKERASYLSATEQTELTLTDQIALAEERAAKKAKLEAEERAYKAKAKKLSYYLSVEERAELTPKDEIALAEFIEREIEKGNRYLSKYDLGVYLDENLLKKK